MKTIKFILVFSLFSIRLLSQEYHNPIIQGFNPDPSICRVGNDYYIINSSFEYFPGIPIYHSTDLVNWQLISYVLTRRSQLNMEGFNASEGIYAPTIRYNKGTFYVVVSLVTQNPRRVRNILMTAKSPKGPWSEPYLLTDSTLWAIDPDLFFDDDGKCYFTANRKHQVEQPYNCFREIAIQELDINKMKLVGEIKVIGDGALKGACTAEAPHIYKKDNKYYLLISEGGTFMNHAVTISSADNIFGPYQQFPGNPILTHRHMQNTLNIRNTGHADIVQTQNGEWWLVCLAVRYQNDMSFMGRETFLVPMIWEKNSYPVISPSVGFVMPTHKLPAIAKTANNPKMKFHDDFSSQNLDLSWNFLRTPGEFYKITAPGTLKINLQSSTISELKTPSFLGRRIENTDFTASLKMNFHTDKNSEEAGLILLNDNKNHIKLTFNNSDLRLIEVFEGKENIIGQLSIPVEKPKFLKVESRNQKLSFYYSEDNSKWTVLKEAIPGKALNALTFTGSFIGFYGSSNGDETANSFEIDWFGYTNN